VLITEHMSGEQRAALDEQLNGPDRSQRAAVVGQLGGEVRGGKR